MWTEKGVGVVFADGFGLGSSGEGVGVERRLEGWS